MDDNPAIEAEEETEWDIPKNLVDNIDTSARIKAARQVEDHYVAPIKIEVDYPLTWRHIKKLSKFLTKQCDRPIRVLPKMTYKSSLKHDHVRDFPKVGEYCVFEAHVTMFQTDDNKSSIFEVGSITEKLDKYKEHEGYAISFPGDQVNKGYYQPELSFKMERRAYSMAHKKANIIAFSGQELEVGQLYLIGGIMWSAADRKNTHAVPKQDLHMLIDWAIPKRNLLELDDNFFIKFRNLTHDTVRDACAYPFENSISDYKELVFLALFYIKSGNIPLNILLMGRPGCTKSAFLKKIAAVSGDGFVDGGAATLKGLMPSFSPRSTSAGSFSIARHFVIVNEFLNIVRGINEANESFPQLSKMKQILEGQPADVVSGNGSVRVTMRGSTFFASNWVELGRGGRLYSVEDLYNRIDPALLDRFLIYPVRQKIQLELVDMHTEDVKEKMTQYMKNNGGSHTDVGDEVNVLERMPTPYPLTTYDLRTLLVFREGLVSRLTREAKSSLNDGVERIHSKYSYNRFTRARDMLSNIASAYAFESALVRGAVTRDTKEILVEKEHVQIAIDYLNGIMRFYDGSQENERQTRAEVYKHSLTVPQRYVVDELRRKFEAGTDASNRMVDFDSMVDEFRKRYGEIEWVYVIKPLIQKRLVVWGGGHLMWVHHQLEDGAVDALFAGESGRYPFIDALVSQSLLIPNETGALTCPWTSELPVLPTEEVQKLVRGILKDGCVPLQDIKQKARIDTAVTENAVRYMHLAGELSLCQGGYMVRPMNEGKKEEM